MNRVNGRVETSLVAGVVMAYPCLRCGVAVLETILIFC